MLEHGGRLHAAAQKYGIPESEWLDLSTGINPVGYPVLALPLDAWRRLPDGDDALRAAAARYYGSESVLPVAGTQAAIQALPRLRTPSRVAVLSPTYGEHAHVWRRSGHVVRELAADEIESALDHLDVVVLANPNNPTGLCFAGDTLARWRRHLVDRGGWLVVDEAFMDATPEASLVSQATLPGLIVLRSIGKFFGLAGARVGFVFSGTDLRLALEKELGPWAVSGPAQQLATQALADTAWQETARTQLTAAGARLARLLDERGLAPAGGTVLFQWVRTPHAATLHEQLARRGILTRLFSDAQGRASVVGAPSGEANPARRMPGTTEPTSLRFGLPGTQTQWERLAHVLHEVLTDATHEMV